MLLMSSEEPDADDWDTEAVTGSVKTDAFQDRISIHLMIDMNL